MKAVKPAQREKNMIKKDKDRMAELIAKGDAITDEEKTELALFQEYAVEDVAEKAPAPDSRDGASSVVTMRDGKATKVFFKDGKEVGAGYLAFYNSGNVYLRKYTAYSTYDGNLTSAAYSVAAGDMLRIKRVGNVITASVYHSGAWADAVSITDSSSPLSAGQPGILQYGNSGRMDSWQGFDL